MDENFFEDEPSTPLLPEQQADDLPQSNLELGRPGLPSRRKRVIQISLVVVALVTLLVTLRGVILPPRPTTQALPPLPPPATLVMSNISFGTVTINGQRQRDTLPLILIEQETTYTITINAPPFQTKSCTFSFRNGTPQPLTSSHPGCFVGSISGGPEMTLNGVTRDPTTTVTIEFTAADLPSDQQQQINTLLLHSITARQSTTVPSGSYIATGLDAASNISSQRTSAPVRATAMLVPNANFEQGAFACAGLTCQVHFNPDELAPRAGMQWDINVPVALRWRFTASDGSLRGDVLFPAADIIPVTLVYADATGWSLSPQTPFETDIAAGAFTGLDCSTGSRILQQRLQGMNPDITMYPASKGIGGCQIILAANQNPTQGSFLCRFGVLLAGDSAAHTLLPALPIAPAAEIKAVQG